MVLGETGAYKKKDDIELQIWNRITNDQAFSKKFGHRLKIKK